MAKEVKEGSDFNQLTIRLEKESIRLCNETYKATKKPPPEKELKDLMKRADALIGEFDELLETYTGGRRAALEGVESQIESLREFTATLRKMKGKP